MLTPGLGQGGPGGRLENALKLAIADTYVMGVSTRAVTKITERLSGMELSAAQVSRVARTAQSWRKRIPQLADWMEQNLPEGFTAYHFPRRAPERSRTINGLKILNKQIRRRTKVAGIFPNVE